MDYPSAIEIYFHDWTKITMTHRVSEMKDCYATLEELWRKQDVVGRQLSVWLRLLLSTQPMKGTIRERL